MNTQIKPYENDTKDRIAVIYANGPILYTEGSEEIIGKKALNRALDEILENKNIKGVVLRIDSPGGDAMTSEIILNTMRNLKGKKPVVVSMGNVAASGGYYIACLGDKIYADPMTITGSIGVFAAFPNIKGLADRIGVNAEQVNSNKNSMGYSLFEPLSEGFKNSTRSAIKKIYSTFKSRVAEGRSIEMEKVESLSQGRVWSGKDALHIGLVDTLGGLQDAIEGADVFLGLSSKSILSKKMVKKMSINPIIFACANPDPEITPEEVEEVRKDAIIATGRSDYPNQVNNLIGFPYIFRGALDVRAKTINEEMKIAAANAIASLARERVPDEVVAAMGGDRPSYGKDYIIPSTFDPRLISVIPVAVAKAAMKTGVARKLSLIHI